MPIAAWSDIVDAGDPLEAAAPQRASFADIESVMPAAAAAPAPRRATFADIVEINPQPALSPLEEEVIAGSPATMSRTAPDQAFDLAPTQPTVEPLGAGRSLMDAVRKSAPGRFVAGAAVPVTSIVQGGMALGKTAADQVRAGGVAAVPGAVSSIVTGAARSLVEPAVSAIVPPLMERKPGETALGAVDQVIPLRDIASRVQGGDYAGAAGEVLSTAAMIAGPHAVERFRPSMPRGRVREAPSVDVPEAAARAEVPVPEAAPRPNLARFDDIAAVEAPPRAKASAEPVPPQVAHVNDITEVHPPAADVEPAPAKAAVEELLRQVAKEPEAEPAQTSAAEPVAEPARYAEGNERPVAEAPARAAEPAAAEDAAPAARAATDAGGDGGVQPDAAPGRPAEDARGPVDDDAGVQAMPDSSRHADASGALVPSPASRALSLLKPGEKQLRPSEIVHELSKAFDDLPVKVGKFKQEALGIYKPREQVVRLKVANDLSVLAHEIGHHVHETVMGAENPAKGYRGELETLGLATSRDSYTLKQKLQEGQAEFTRLYLSDPAEAQTRAPNYYHAFETGLEKHPELAAVLQRAQRQYVGHLSLDPVQRAMSRIDFDGRDASPKADVVTRLQANLVDDLHPLKKMVEDLAGNQPIDYTKNGYVLARLARGASAKADGFLRHGVRAGDGAFVAPALEPALKPVRKQIKEFATYLAAERAIELRGRGMQTGMTLGEANAVVAKHKSPTFDTARDAVYAYQDGLLHYAREHGTLSADQLKAIKELNKAYVPFQRVMDDVGSSAGGGGKRGIANQASQVKRIKGSGRDIINPLESIVKNTHTLVGMVEQNRAMQALVDQATSTKGGGRYLEEIPEKQVATMFNLGKLAKEIKGELAASGVDVPDNLDFDKLVTVFTPTQQRFGEKGVVSVLADGKRKWFAVNDPAIHEAIAAIGPKPAGLVIKLMRGPASLLRAGATTTVGFIARNPIRDTFEAGVNSRYGFTPVVDTVKGLFEYAKKGADYEQFMNSGAGNAALASVDRNRIRQELGKMDGSARRKLLSTVVHGPVDLLRAVSEAMEHATRLGEFKKAIETEGRTAEGYARAALAARDVTLDFARGGTSLREANQIIAFLNAGAQGLARTREVFQQNPVRSTMRALTYITAPTLMLYAVNRHDPSYKELPEWERATFWHIPNGLAPGHSWIRIPKPIGLGNIFGTVPQAAAEYLDTGNRASLDALLPSKEEAMREVMGMMPNAFLPIAEAGANYDFFRQRAIVNPDDVNLDTELQYNRWTSSLAKFVGPKIGIAPAKLDHLVYGYGGGLAAGAVSAVDRAGEALGVIPRKKPAGGLAQTPLIGTFARETAGADAQSLQDFYKLRDRVEGAVGSIKRYEKTGDQTAADARKERARTDLGPDPNQTDARVKETGKALTELRDAVNQVFASERLDPDEKKELLDRLYEQMVNAARAGMEKPALPSRFPKPPAPALLDKMRPAKPSAPAGRPPAVESRPSALPPPRPTVTTPPPR